MSFHRGGLERQVVPGPALRCVSDGTSTDGSRLWHVGTYIKPHLYLLPKRTQSPEWRSEWNQGARIRLHTGRSDRYGRGGISASWTSRRGHSERIHYSDQEHTSLH